jgi:hypothetical protein
MAKASGRRYKRQQQEAERFYVMCCLRPDAWLAVTRTMDDLEISASGAVHHLVRLASGLEPLTPS